MTANVRILPDAQALFRAAADAFALAARQAGAQSGVFRVALSGGQTPRGIYALLASDATVPWDRTHVFWGDERHVPPDHADSNYRMVREVLLSKIPIASDHVHRIRAEMSDAGRAADDYEETLRRQFGLSPGQWPAFDLVLLGLGSDAHTASLFPGTAALRETQRLVVANAVEKLKTERITLTPPVFDHARRVAFVVSGQDKAPALAAVLEGPRDPERFPAQSIAPASGDLTFFVDKAAAAKLSTHADEVRRC